MDNIKTLDQSIGFIIPDTYYILVGNYYIKPSNATLIGWDNVRLKKIYKYEEEKFVFDEKTPFDKIGRVYILFGSNYEHIKYFFNHIEKLCTELKRFFQIYDGRKHSYLSPKNSRIFINGKESTDFKPSVYNTMIFDNDVIRKHNKKNIEISIKFLIKSYKYDGDLLLRLYDRNIDRKLFTASYMYYADILKSSKLFSDFYDDFPLSTNNLSNVAGLSRIVESQVNECKVLINKYVASYIDKYLDIMKVSGTPKQKFIYKDMTQDEFIVRCITKRPLSFYKSWNVYRLRSKIQREYNKENRINDGWFDYMVNFPYRKELPYYYEIKDEFLEDYISYDEMLFSSYIGISCPTLFLNDGDRDNLGIVTEKHIARGILTALVGFRFQEFLHQEALFIATTPAHTKNMGFGEDLSKDAKYKLWADFYRKDYLPTYDDLENSQNPHFLKRYWFCPISKIYIDIEAYKQKLWFTYKMYIDDIILRYSDQFRKLYLDSNKPLYIIFKDINHEDDYDRTKSKEGKITIDKKFQTFMMTCVILQHLENYIINCENSKGTEREIKMVIDTVEFNNIDCIDTEDPDGIEYKNPENFVGIYDADFHRIIETKSIYDYGNYKTIIKAVKRRIKIKYSDLPPFRENLQDYCVACNYAWSANSLVGNEYWDNGLNYSDSSAMACCSTISQLQNPYINYTLLSKKSITYLD